MKITSIKLINFRNHQYLYIDEIGKMLVIVGNNAVGKTNIVEALQLLSMHESFRKPKIEELLCNKNSEEEEAKISIEIEINGATNTKQLSLRKNNRSFSFNQKDKSSKELIDMIPAVLFTPDDLQIIKGQPEQRRDLLDTLGCRLSKSFASIRGEYIKALRHKNSLLKQERVEIPLLDSWNINLSKLGASLSKHRFGLFEKLLNEAAVYYKRISGGEILDGTYKAQWKEAAEEQGATEEATFLRTGSEENDMLEAEEGELYSVFCQYQEREIAAKRSLVGPQRDDVCFTINGKDARRFASQGQQRSVALSLKMAEIEILKRVSGKNPLLLLDDVMSELDTNRRKDFVSLIGEASQTILTTTNLGYFDEDFLERATVVTLDG